MSSIGARLPRTEDPRLLRGRGRFGDDISAPGQLWARVVRSPCAHGHLNDLDTTQATKVPGGDHGGDARGPGRLGHVQGADPAVGRRGPNDPSVELPRSAHVVAEPAAAAQQARVFLARQPGADGGHGLCRARAVARSASTMPW